MTLTNVNILSNTATAWGGGVAAGGAATLSGGLFQRNQSGLVGGGLGTVDTLTLTGTQFLSNTATAGGGGVAVGGAATLSGGLFQNNQSSLVGGGLIASGTLTLTGTQFLSNTATAGGGGVAAGGAATLSGGLFQNNQSSLGGGLIASGTLALTGTQFSSNTAVEGGGIYQGGSGAGRLVNALFARNAASGNGSAIYLGSSGVVEILHTTIASPTVGAGAAIYVNFDPVNITNTIIAGYTTGIQQAGSSTVYQDYNLFYNTTPTAGTVGGGTHSFTGDPAFVNINTDDYHLTGASAAIDAGFDAGVTTDLDGTARPFPQGGRFDIGAYEAMPDLAISKVAAPEPAIAGTSLVYTITIANGSYPTTALGSGPFRYALAQHHARLYGSDRRRWHRVGLWRRDEAEHPMERPSARRPRRRVAGVGESQSLHRRVHLARDGRHQRGSLEQFALDALATLWQRTAQQPPGRNRLRDGQRQHVGERCFAAPERKRRSDHF